MTELLKTSLSNITISVVSEMDNRARARSYCWRYFGSLVISDSSGKKKKTVNSDQIYCIVCLNAVKNESEDVTFGSVKIKTYNKTVSTGNLTRHLRDDHNIIEPVAKSETPKAKFSIQELFHRRSSRAGNKTRPDPWLLARDVALWCCKSMIPFDLVCDVGMMDFMTKYSSDPMFFESEDRLPSRQTISGAALDDIYKTMLADAREKIRADDPRHLAISFDSWVDNSKGHRYVTVTLHYLDSDFNLNKYTLRTQPLDENETIEQIIKNLKQQFSLNGRTIFTVADGHRSTLIHDTEQHQCLGYGLHNLVVSDGIKAIPEMYTLVQKCITIIKELAERAYLLEGETKKGQREFFANLDDITQWLQTDEDDPIPNNDGTLPVKSEGVLKDLNPQINEDDTVSVSVNIEYIPDPNIRVPTRWHIILRILETLIHRSNDLNAILKKFGKNELQISQNEWVLLVESVKFLSKISTVVEVITSQKTCTMNVALVFRSEIIDILESSEEEESFNISRLKINMLANIDKRFPVTRNIVAAALMDNRFIGLKGVDKYLDSKNISRIAFLIGYVKELIDIDIIKEEVPDADSLASTSSEKTSLLQKLSKKHCVSDSVIDDPVDQECWRYVALANPSEPKDGNLLSYWNTKKSIFPRLSAFAKALLCIPATCTPVETVFSAKGLLNSAKRLRLNRNKLDKIIFIHDNYDICKTEPHLP